jgi:hypothetical protein
MNPLGGIGRGSSIPNWTIPYIIADSYEHQAFQVRKWAEETTKK